MSSTQAGRCSGSRLSLRPPLSAADILDFYGPRSRSDAGRRAGQRSRGTNYRASAIGHRSSTSRRIPGVFRSTRKVVPDRHRRAILTDTEVRHPILRPPGVRARPSRPARSAHPPVGNPSLLVDYHLIERETNGNGKWNLQVLSAGTHQLNISSLPDPLPRQANP
jgi:hypothetical protein